MIQRWCKSEGKREKKRETKQVFYFFPSWIDLTTHGCFLKMNLQRSTTGDISNQLVEPERTDKGPQILLHWERTSCGRAHQMCSSSSGPVAGLPRPFFYDTFRLHYGDTNRIFLHAGTSPRHVLPWVCIRKQAQMCFHLWSAAGCFAFWRLCNISFDFDNMLMRERLDKICFLKKPKLDYFNGSESHQCCADALLFIKGYFCSDVYLRCLLALLYS